MGRNALGSAPGVAPAFLFLTKTDFALPLVLPLRFFFSNKRPFRAIYSYCSAPSIAPAFFVFLQNKRETFLCYLQLLLALSLRGAKFFQENNHFRNTIACRHVCKHKCVQTEMRANRNECPPGVSRVPMQPFARSGPI